MGTWLAQGRGVLLWRGPLSSTEFSCTVLGLCLTLSNNKNQNYCSGMREGTNTQRGLTEITGSAHQELHSRRGDGEKMGKPTAAPWFSDPVP